MKWKKEMSFVSYFVCCLVSRTRREVELGGLDCFY